MLKILQGRLQQYVNRKLPDVQAGFRKVRRTRVQIANIHWIIEKASKFQKNIYFCFIDYAKAFHCVDHNKLWKILKEMVLVTTSEMTQNIQDIQKTDRTPLWPEEQLGKLIAIYYYKALLRQNSRL